MCEKKKKIACKIYKKLKTKLLYICNIINILIDKGIEWYENIINIIKIKLVIYYINKKKRKIINKFLLYVKKYKKIEMLVYKFNNLVIKIKGYINKPTIENKNANIIEMYYKENYTMETESYIYSNKINKECYIKEDYNGYKINKTDDYFYFIEKLDKEDISWKQIQYKFEQPLTISIIEKLELEENKQYSYLNISVKNKYDTNEISVDYIINILLEIIAKEIICIYIYTESHNNKFIYDLLLCVKRKKIEYISDKCLLILKKEKLIETKVAINLNIKEYLNRKKFLENWQINILSDKIKHIGSDFLVCRITNYLIELKELENTFIIGYYLNMFNGINEIEILKNKLNKNNEIKINKKYKLVNNMYLQKTKDNYIYISFFKKIKSRYKNYRIILIIIMIILIYF